MRQKRVKRTAAEQSSCGCDLYVRQEMVNALRQSRVLVGVTCMCEALRVWPIGDRDFLYLYNVYS